MLATAGVMLAVAGAAAPGRADDAPPESQTVSVTIQAVWQVQQGCTRDCHDTSQTQMAVQSSTTVQVAGTPDGGAASNRHVTIQIVVQSQRGCQELCYGTEQLQTAVQQIDVNQVAQAIADASNDATTTQFVWQYQQGCEVECHDATSTQVSQGVQAPPPFAVDLDAFRTWVTALAAGLSATLDFLEQHDVAACLEHCTGDGQLQLGVQADVTVQVDAGSATASTAAVVEALRPARARPLPTVKRPTCRAAKTKTTKRRARRSRCAARRTTVRPSSHGRRSYTRHWRDSGGP